MFKHFIGFFLVLGTLFLGCVYWWMDQDESSQQIEEENKYWNPIEEVPKLGELIQKEDIIPSLESKSKSFLLIAENPLQSNERFVFIAEYNPSSNGLTMSAIPSHELQAVSNSSDNENELKYKIEEQFGTEIDHTVTLNMDGLIDVIDELVPEGIEVTITESMIEKYQLKSEPGTYTLKGEDLLNADSDFSRVLLQPEVIASIKSSITNELQGFEGMLKIPSLLKDVQASVQTDMNMNELVSIVSTVAFTGVDEVKNLTIPVMGEAEGIGDQKDKEKESNQSPVENTNYPAGL